MKITKAMAFAGTLSALACAATGEVPSSERSRDAVERTAPVLEKAFIERELSLGSPVFMRIFKDPAVLEVWVQLERDYQLFRAYPICAFSGTPGPKLKEGDRQAPEGFYSVASEQMNPNSSYHLSFNLGFPNEYDRAKGRTGSFLMVHGDCRSVGCYAMGDEAIEEIWTIAVAALKGGQSTFAVHCFPFPLTEENLERHADHDWIEFWRELKPGFDFFEKQRVPPAIFVRDGRYVVEVP